MFRRLIRHIKEGVYGVVRHGAMAISSASAVTITLCLISIFFIFSYNINVITEGVEDTLNISVQIDYEYEADEQMQSIKKQIMNIPGVIAAEFVSKENELEFYIDSVCEDDQCRAIYTNYEESDENPMHHSYYVNVNDGKMISDVAAKIEQIDGVFRVNYGGNEAIMLVGALNSVQYGGAILVAALCALAIFLIANTIKLTIYARSKEISIMRCVGATNGYIRAPFMIEGMIIGFLGAIIPVLLTIFGYIYLYQALGGIWLSELFVMVKPHPFVLHLAGILILIGMIVGLIGSFFSVTKYLRWKR